MKNHVIRLDKNQGKDLAEKAFRDMCGYNRGKTVSPKIIERSLRSLDDVDDQIAITVLISEYEKPYYDGTEMILDGQAFFCQALAQIPAGEIERVYVYLLTAGEVDLSGASGLNSVYYDIWQNAYVDAGQEILRRHLQGLSCNHDKFVSGNFGPGYFGMEISLVEKIFSILDADKINMKLLSGGFMYPLKSYAGFFAVTSSKQNVAEIDCDNCMSSGKTCVYCRAGRKMKQALFS
ncbi:vitamin B12 dependent methionine synthase [Dehalobacter sp. DCM]|uniref:vitamin B12 dependent methionine synthase n=1 Tax=Dehalobacter sp. DCM TaxID=2907827 RepID=UPI003081D566|nr:vitamin B12 dependent methionine synthase [Dehalobacter sp. DCM]